MLKGAKDIADAVGKLQEENAALRSQIDEFQRMRNAEIAREYAAKIDDNPIVSEIVDFDLNVVRDNLVQLRNTHPDMALILGSSFGDKPSLLIVLGQNRVDAGANAGQMVRTAGKEIQGGGGGQAHFATAGGRNLAGLQAAVAAAKSLLV